MSDAEHWALVMVFTSTCGISIKTRTSDTYQLKKTRVPSTMNSPDIPLDIQFLIHTLSMWLQAAQAVTGIVHSPRCLVPVRRVGWETKLTTDSQPHSLSI